MSEGIPEGWHSITTRLVADDPAKLVAFLKSAFGAQGTYETSKPSTLRIGDSHVMVSGTGPREATRAFLHLYVADADATFHRAMEAGATCIEEPAIMPWGDRRAMIEDPSGNAWQIATAPLSS